MAFDPNQSSSYISSNNTAWIKFGSGMLTGELGSDDVRVGFGDKEIFVKNTSVGLIIND